MTQKTCHASAAAETNERVTSLPRELTLCLCERARGDAGCNCADMVPPLEDRIAAIFRELQDELAALREAV